MEYNDNLSSIFDDLEDNQEVQENQQEFTLEEPTNEQTEENNDDSELNIEDIFNDTEDENKTTESKSDHKSTIDKFLESKGFIDSKIKILDEDENVTEVSFSELTEEEQLDVLNSLGSQPKGNSYTETETQWIDELKENNMSIEDFLEIFKTQVIEQYTQNSETEYDIDSYTDEELFLLDQKLRYGLEQEDLETTLAKELENKALFDTKVEKIREEYRKLEEEEKEYQKSEFEAQQQREYDTFVNQMVEVAGNINEFHGLELEESDKNDTLSYMLNLDATGSSEFHKELRNPNRMYEAAWYLKHGKDAFRIISEAYEAEIARLKKTKDKPSVIVRQ